SPWDKTFASPLDASPRDPASPAKLVTKVGGPAWHEGSHPLPFARHRRSPGGGGPPRQDCLPGPAWRRRDVARFGNSGDAAPPRPGILVPPKRTDGGRHQEGRAMKTTAGATS